MTYLQFLLIFLVAPAALLLAYYGTIHLRLLAAAIAIATAAALAYGIPWAYVLVRTGVWQFDSGAVGTKLWRLPWELFAAIVVQAIFTGTLMALALRRPWGRK